MASVPGTAVPRFPLTGEVSVPQLGFGVGEAPAREVGKAVRLALDAGYRAFDVPPDRGTEAAVATALADSDVPRDDVFVTGKLAEHGYDAAMRAFEATLAAFRTDRLDACLVHWPLPALDSYVDTWRALGKVRAGGGARVVGVANFQPVHLRRLLDETGMVPTLNQVELHPHLSQAALREFHAARGIVTAAWCPFARGMSLVDPTVRALASKYGKTPAQIVLRWHLQHGIVVSVKAVTPSRIVENIDVFDFELAEDDLTVLDELDDGTRACPDPDAYTGPRGR